MQAHEAFAWMELSVQQLQEICLDRWDFSFEITERRFDGHFLIPQPGVLITKAHVENALGRKRLGIVSERDLVLWATMILLNDAYEIDERDEDLIADWLNDMSLELDPEARDER